MTQIYRLVFKLSWVLGLLGILAGVVIKLAHLEARVTVASHTAFIVAGSLGAMKAVKPTKKADSGKIVRVWLVLLGL